MPGKEGAARADSARAQTEVRTNDGGGRGLEAVAEATLDPVKDSGVRVVERADMAEVPRALKGDPARWEPSDEPAGPRRELEAAYREIQRLSVELDLLRSERDQALWTALTVELDVGEEIEATRREAHRARQQSARDRRLRHQSEQRAADQLMRFERQIADLRERLAALQGLLQIM